MKKILLGWVIGLGLSMIGISSAIAEWAPSGPIKMMIAFKAGGGADTQARMIAEHIEANKGWKIIPEQVTGKGGANLARAMKGQANDGTVIGMAITETFTYNMKAAKNPGYTPEDFTFLTTTAGFQMGVVARTDRGFSSWEDVIAAAKGGETIRFGVMSARLDDVAYLLGKASGIEFNNVMVKGGKGVMNGLNAGDLDIGWGAGIQAKAVKAGDMVNLLSGISTRLDVSPNAPTMKEAVGLEFTGEGHFTFVAPAGVPAEAREALISAISAAINDPDSKANGFINKGFGGVVEIAGDDLTKLVADEGEAADKLMAAASE